MAIIDKTMNLSIKKASKKVAKLPSCLHISI